jgi:uncharacterized protein
MHDLETRFSETRFDVKKRTVSGYAAVFYDGTEGTQFELAPGVIERVHPNAFDASLKDGKLKLYRMHDRRQGIARQPATLRISKDAKGIAYEANIIDNTAGRDAVAELESGYITGASVGMRFTPSDVKMTKEGRNQIITIMRADLEEISLVDDGAYRATTAVLRWADEQKATTLDEWQKIAADLLNRATGPSAGKRA